MTLGERIGAQRRRCGLSQERVAEQVGVSRQAVTKWESGQSTPSTENLFKLAELFGTTVDLLTAEPKEETATPEQRAYQLFKEEETRRAAETKHRRREKLLAALWVAVGYLAIYLIGRLIWCGGRESSVLGWLLWNRPAGENSYLYGWLLSSRLFWCAAVVSVCAALAGRKRLALATLVGFAVGLVTGIFFGFYPQARPGGYDHYGWLIWGVCFLLSILVGSVWEWLKRKRRKAP